MPFQEIGASAKEKFVSKCVKDPANFKKPIKKQKAITFATQLKKYKIKGDEKGEITTMIRGLFVNLYKKEKVDMAEVLRYPLTPLPLSLCHTDGRMQSTPKSALLNEIEARVACVLTEYIDVIIVDGVFFFLHLFIDLLSTMGQTVTVILKKTCSSCNSDTIHLVFDKMVTPSIKELEHKS